MRVGRAIARVRTCTLARTVLFPRFAHTRPPKPRISEREKSGKSQIEIPSRFRVNVASPNLCDDILGQLAPSLAAYRNCDIIDVNPGTGLWSSKVHDYLRPRTHILLEPEKDYIPSLLPLLNQPESTYRHVQLSGMEWSSYEKIVDDRLLPCQRLLGEGDPGYNSTNTTLLFLANLGQYPERKWGDFKSISHLMIHQLITAIRTHSIFHRYGFVRMLIWTMDASKAALLPRTVANRRRFTIQAEVACEKIHEVAGAEGGPGKNRRDIALDVASSKRVAMLMEQDGLQTPEDRKGAAGEASKEDFTHEGQQVERVDVNGSGRSWRKELKELESDYKNNKFVRFATGQDGQVGRRSPTKNYARLSHLRTFASQMQKRKTVVDQLLRVGEDLEAAEESALSTKPEQQDEVAKLRENYKKEVERHPISVQEGLALASDDRKALAMDPQLLMWDRRTREPIIVEKSEFEPQVRSYSFARQRVRPADTPQKPLTLLDMLPRAYPAGLSRTPDSHTYFDFILSCLFLQPRQPIVRGLETLAPGAAADIIPLVPSLHDPKRGGRRNLDQLRVRMLTAEMIEELVVAWENWPFKPSMGEMMMKMGVDRRQTPHGRL